MKRKLSLTWALVALTFAFASSQTNTSKELLSVGDTPPAVSVFKWIKGQPINEFEKGKVHVVEFGATWCAPCAAAIPKLSRVADKFGSDVTVTSFFVMEKMKNKPESEEPSYATNVENYVRKRWDMIHYNVAVDDQARTMEKDWLRAAGKNGVPYIFIIDKEGRIAWIGSHPSAIDSLITTLIRGNTLAKVAPPVPFDETKLYLIDGNGGDDHEFAFRSILSKYKGDVKVPNPEYIQSWRIGNESIYTHRRDRVQVIGASLAKLYYMAFGDTLWNQHYTRNFQDQYIDTLENPNLKRSYGKYWHKPVFEVADLAPFMTNRHSARNKYNYSLKVPEGLGWAKFLQEAMQRDLKTYFGYNVRVETRMMPYWKLSILSETQVATLKSPDQNGLFNMDGTTHPYEFKNATTRDIIWMLGSNYGFNSYDYGRLPLADQGAFMDETGSTYKIDFNFDQRLGFADQVKALNIMGFDLKRSYKPMKVVVIGEAVPTNTQSLRVK